AGLLVKTPTNDFSRAFLSFGVAELRLPNKASQGGCRGHFRRRQRRLRFPSIIRSAERRRDRFLRRVVPGNNKPRMQRPRVRELRRRRLSDRSDSLHKERCWLVGSSRKRRANREPNRSRPATFPDAAPTEEPGYFARPAPCEFQARAS